MSDTAAGDRTIRLYHRPPFGEEAMSLEQFAEEVGVDAEEALYMLLRLGCAGEVETDIFAGWRLTESGHDRLTTA